MIQMIFFYIALINAQYYGSQTQIDYCLRQSSSNYNCLECPDFFKLEYNPSTNRQECRFVEHCIKFEKGSKIFIGDEIIYDGYLELSTGDSRYFEKVFYGGDTNDVTTDACFQCEEGYRININTFVCEPGTEYGYFSDYLKTKKYEVNDKYEITN